MVRFLDKILSLEFSDADTLAINGFISGNLKEASTMLVAYVVRLSLSSTKTSREKLLNNQLISMFSRLAVEIDGERSTLENVRIIIHNANFHGQLMTSGKHSYGKVIR